MRVEEQISKLTLASNIWVEPMRNWLKLAVSLCEIAKSGSFEAKKEALLQIDGLNLFLKSKKAQGAAAPEISPPLKNPWSALRATKVKAAHAGDQIQKSFLVAGETGLEPATNGFGDRYSTIEPLPSTNTYCNRKAPTSLAEISTDSRMLKN